MSKKGENAMKKSARIISLLIILVLLFNAVAFTVGAAPDAEVEAAAAAETEVDYTEYVNLFNSTGGDHGQLSPSAQVPHGLVKLGADTWPKKSGQAQSGYDFNSALVRGFSHTRVEGTGNVGSGGDIRFMPSLSAPTAGFDPETGSMYKANERAETGYYKTDLTSVQPTYAGTTPDEKLAEVVATDPDTTIVAEMTARTRTGYHKYTFPTDTAYFYIDLGDAFAGRPTDGAYIAITGDRTLEGYVIGGNVTGRTTNFYKLYFAIEFEKAFTTAQLYDNSEALTTDTEERGANVGAVISIDGVAGEPIYAKVTLSPISIEQAKRDMASEAPDFNFDDARADAKAAWQDILSRVVITDSRTDEHTRDLIEMTYTALYRTFTMPMNATSTDGTYMGFDGNVYDAEGAIHYDGWSLWDDYRKYPLIGIIAPEVYNDIIRSISDHFVHKYENGSGEYWAVPNVGYENSVTLIADGIAKGYWDEDMETVYEAIKSSSGRFGSEDYKTGYKSSVSEVVSDTLEYSYSDYCQALIAIALAERMYDEGNTEKYNYYIDQAERYLKGAVFYRNLWLDNATTNSETGEGIGLFVPKDLYGETVAYDPLKFAGYCYEGNLWHWRWATPHDVKGAAHLSGGTEKMLADLTYFFDQNWFSAVNETDLQAPYMFNMLGAPSLTQKWVHNIYTEQITQVFHNHGAYSTPVTDYIYKNQIEAFPESMDEDTGTMSAMFLAATLGIFPFVAGDGTFQIGSPAFESVTLDIGGGKTFTVKAEGVSRNSFYIQSATLNGKEFNRTWLDYSEIARGGTVVFKMGEEPSDWAADGAQPVSASDITDDVIEDMAKNQPQYVDPTLPDTPSAPTEGGYSTPDVSEDGGKDYLAYWSFDDTLADAGGIYDISATATPSYTSGKLGGAVSTSSAIKLTNYDDVFGFGTSDFSVSVWFKTTGNGNIVGREETTGNRGWSVRVDGGKLGFNAHDNASYRISSAEAVNDGEWHHAALVLREGTASLYLDGALCGTKTGFGSLNYDDYLSAHDIPLSIGHRSQTSSGNLTSGNFLSGAIDEVIIYDKAIDEAKISELYSVSESTEEDKPLEAYWNFDGSATDESGSYEFSGTSTVGYTDGKYLGGAKLSGYALTQDSADFDFGAGSFAVALWVKLDATTAGTIIAKEDTGSNTGWSIRLDGGVFQFNIKDNVAAYGVSSAVVPEAGIWYHLAAVRDGGTVYLYVNGELVGSNSALGAGTSLTSSANLVIGARTSNGSISNFRAMTVDELKIYGYSLDAAAVAELYGTVPPMPVTPAPTDYIAYWMLNGNLKDITERHDLVSSSAVDYTDGMDGFDEALGSLSDSKNNIYTEDEDFDFGTGSFTVSLWFRYNAAAATLISKEDYGTAKSGWSLRINSGQLQFNTPRSTSYRIATTAPATNEWHHAVIIRDGATAYMYLNGELVGSSNIGAANLSSPSPLRIGARTTNGAPNQYLNGSVDEVKIFDYAVSAEEAVALYGEMPSTIIKASDSALREGSDNGSVPGQIVNTIRLRLAGGERWDTGDFAYTEVAEGSEIVWGVGDTAIKLWGLPSGLTPVFTRIDDYTLELSLIGTADSHDGGLDTLHVEVNPAFIIKDGASLTDEDRISGSILEIPILFYAGRLSYSESVLTESVSGSGIITTVIEVDILDESGADLPDIEFSCGPNGALVVGRDIVIENMPEGISAVATTGSDPTKLYISFVGTTSVRLDADNISIHFEQSAFNTDTKVIYGVDMCGIAVDLTNPRAWYSSTVLRESSENDGSVTESITIMLTDVSFIGENGSALAHSISGLPEGLAITVTKLDDHTALLTVSGNAKAHALSDTTSIRISFSESAISGAPLENILGVSEEMKLTFADKSVVYSSCAIVESPENNGEIYLPLILTLSEGGFNGSAGEDFIKSGKLSVFGLPSGLSAAAQLLSDGSLMLRFLGAAEAHTCADSVEKIGVSFADEAFLTGDATDYRGSNISGLAGLRIYFRNEAGEEPEHVFVPATCTEPKMCVDCHKTVGEALGHMYVGDACAACGLSRAGFIPGEVIKTQKDFGSVGDNSAAFHKSSGTVGGVNYTKFYFDAPESNTNTKTGYIQISFDAADVVIRDSGSYVKNTDYLVLDFDVSTDSVMFEKLQFHARFKNATGGTAQNPATYPVLVGNNVRGLYVSDGTSLGGNEISAPDTDYGKAWRHISFVYDFSGNNPLGYVNYVYIDGMYAGSMEACISSAVYLNFFRVIPKEAFSSLTDGTNVKFANLTATRFGVDYDGLIDDVGVLANPAVSLYDIPELAYCMENLPEGTIGEDVGKLAELTRDGNTEKIYSLYDLDASLQDGDSVKLFANINGSVIVPKGAEIAWDSNGYTMPTLIEYDYSEVHWVTRNPAGEVTAYGGASVKDGRVLTDGLYASIVRSAGRCTVTLLNDYVLYGAGDAGSSVTSGKYIYSDMMLVLDLNGHTMDVELLSGTNSFSTDSAYYHNIRLEVRDGNMVFKPGSSSSFVMMGQSGTVRLDNVDLDVQSATFVDVRCGEMWVKDSNVSINGGELANMRSYHGVRSLLVIDGSTITSNGSYAVDINPLATGDGHASMLDYIVVRNGSVISAPSGYAFAVSTLLPKSCTSCIESQPDNRIFISITDSLVEARDGVLHTEHSVVREGAIIKSKLDIHNSEIRTGTLATLGKGASGSMSEYTHSTDVTVTGASKLDVDALARALDSGALPRVYVADGVLAVSDVESGEGTALYLESPTSDVAYTSLGGEYGYVFTSSYKRYGYKLGDLPAVTEFIWSMAEGDAVDMSRLVSLSEGVDGIYHYEWRLADGIYTAVMVKDFAISAKSNLTLYDYFYYNLFINAEQYDAARDYVTILDSHGNAVYPEETTVEIDGVSYYKFQIKGISPDKATDTAVRVVMSIDGVYSDKWENSIDLSVFNYAKNILKKSSDPNSIRLMQTILNYIAAAMEYKGADADAVRAEIAGVEFDVPDEQKPDGTASDVAVAVRYGDSVSWVIAALEDTAVTVTYTYDGTERTVTKELKKNEEYEIKVKAYDFPSGIFVDSTGGEAAVSIGSYYTALAGDDDAQAMLAAIYNYTVAATAYKK